MLYRPREVAARLAIAPVTLRLWSSRFAAALSSSARPARTNRGYPAQRRYTEADLQALLCVRDLLKQGLTYDQIQPRLQEALVAERTTGEPGCEGPGDVFARHGDDGSATEATGTGGDCSLAADCAVDLTAWEQLEQARDRIASLTRALETRDQTIAALTRALSDRVRQVRALQWERDDTLLKVRQLRQQVDDLMAELHFLNQDLSRPWWERLFGNR